MRGIYHVIKLISQYRNIIIVLAVLIGLAILAILVMSALFHLKEKVEEDKDKKRDDNLKNVDYTTLERDRKASVLRQIIAPDGVDPNSLNYFILNDGGRDVYVRTFTIASMPRYDNFANTFSGLMDYPNCTNSVFVRPISEATMTRKLDKQIYMLNSEEVAAVGNSNRVRKLRAQIEDAEKFAVRVENGDDKFFNVGFLFTLYADSLADLNRQTSDFRAKASAKNITITSCFAVQAEAFARNAPLNHEGSISSEMVNSDAIKWIQMNKSSVSAIYNYTQSSFSHRDGIALGRDMFTAAPVVFDLFDRSHDGFTWIIAGKTGCGKSATIKMWCCRELLHGTHYVAVDSQARRGMSEGEYAGLAQLCDGINFKFSNSSDEVMNIFDLSETTRNEKTDDNTLREIRTLELSDKITMVVHILKTLVKNSSEAPYSAQIETYINRILTDNVKQLYTNFDIRDGDPDSLYTVPGNPLAADKGITSGRPAKILPTLTDYYKQLLISQRDNTDNTLEEAYNIILASLVDYVRELYYSENSCTFFTREQVEKLQYSTTGKKCRQFVNQMRQTENVIERLGNRAYFDGQSTVHISKDCPFTNIDISQLPDPEKKLARQVAMDFVNENYIKKNSENIDAAGKLVCIFDECHEMFNLPYTRETLDGVVRTARKRHVGIILSSQTLSEYMKHPETEAIFKQAAVKFIYKQDHTDKKFLVDSVGLTEAQSQYIVNSLGGNPDDTSDQNRHRGEVCIVDNKRVCFCKVDYRKQTEALPVETDAHGIEELFSISA